LARNALFLLEATVHLFPKERQEMQAILEQINARDEEQE
jgi:hypothetical protein